MGDFVFVTGASSGIGYQASKVLLKEGYKILAGVRTPEDANRLRSELGENIYPLICDVTSAESVQAAVRESRNLLSDGRLVAIINNAGVAIHGAVLYVPVQEWQRQFEINVVGVVRVTQAFFPLLKPPGNQPDDHPRRIINMSSVSGLFASPFMGPYAASKHALEALSDSLRRELYPFDIQVVLIEPGSIITPMWDKARSEKSWSGPEYDSIIAFKDRIVERTMEGGLPVAAMDPIILAAVRDKKVRTRYLIRKDKWKFNLVRRLPTRWIDNMIRKKLQQRAGIRPF